MIKKGKTEFIGIRFTLKDGSKQFISSTPGVFKELIENYLNNNMTENQVLADRVLIRPLTENKSAGGILIGGNSKGRPMKGEIVLVGPGTKDVTMVLVPEDLVLFGEYSGIEVELDGEKDLLLMRQDDVFMKLKKQ